MVRDWNRYKYLDEKVPAIGPPRRKALQNIYNKKRSPVFLILFLFDFNVYFSLFFVIGIWMNLYVLDRGSRVKLRKRA